MTAAQRHNQALHDQARALAPRLRREAIAQFWAGLAHRLHRTLATAGSAQTAQSSRATLEA